MNERMHWIPVVAALIAGMAVGHGLSWPGARSSEPVACRIALDRLARLDPRPSGTGGALDPAREDAFRSETPAMQPASQPSPHATGAPTADGEIARALTQLGAQMDELLDAPLCRSPEALADREDETKLASPENRGAVEDAHRIVEDARQRGVWTEADAVDLRERFAWMTRGQRAELLDVLIPVFQGGLEVESFPPF